METKEISKMNKSELKTFIEKNSHKHYPALWYMQKHELVTLAKSLKK